MKAMIVFTDDDGNTWEHELPLVAHRRVGQGPQGPRGARAKRDEARKPPRSRQTAELDFSLPIRPFIKRYAKGVSGPRRFAILVAHLAKGDVKAEIAFKDIEKQWNKMTQLMGGRFNPAHASRAKDNGWVDSPRHGVYKLLGGWGGALDA